MKNFQTDRSDRLQENRGNNYLGKNMELETFTTTKLKLQRMCFQDILESFQTVEFK